MLPMESDNKKNQNKLTMPLIITISILIAIVSIVIIARGSLKTNEWKSIPTISSNIVLVEDNGLNESEKRVLTILSDWIELPNNPLDKDNDTYTIYLNYLKEYLSSSEVELSTYKALEMEDLIKSRNEIMYLEKESDINKMSFDGREVTIYIFEQIYELCGLKLVFGTERDIEQIADLSGNVIYLKANPLQQTGFQVDALVITLTSILTLFGICIIIAKKNQLFVKGVRYDGFDEKEFA